MLSKILSLISANKLFLALASLFLILICFKNVEISNLKRDNELKNSEIALLKINSQILKSDLEIANEKIAFQNAAIRELEVKKQDADEVKERVVTKFQKIEVPIKDARCEKKLKFYEELINEAAK